MVPERRQTRSVRIGKRTIGAKAPILVQSMTSTRTSDRAATHEQVKRLIDAGCEMIRVAVPDLESAQALDDLKARMTVPLVADIHFDHRLAIAALERGADKIRINPGNIGGEARYAEVLEAVLERDAALRIGVNAGSLEKKLLKEYGRPCAEALVASALGHLRFAERAGVENIVVSIKSSDVLETVKACRLLADATDAPQHLGITEAGLPGYGTVKSAVGLGPLLLEGIGDTIRVSLTGDPVAEVEAAYDILKAVGARIETPEIISCPTCGRMRTDMEKVAREAARLLKNRKLPIRVAIMGCVVNGPGEAKEADIGLAAGEGYGMLFRKGEALRRVSGERMIPELMEEIDRLEEERKRALPEEGH
jgi:(E)-4-hydroxy-3-methylbut-2-enyl-diphosphate synthase